MARFFGSWPAVKRAVGWEEKDQAVYEARKPKILVLDIETAPILAHVWGLFDQNVGVNQIVKDRHLLAWAAIWIDDDKAKMHYRDQRKVKPIENDKAILEDLWKLLDETDVIVTQNGKAFDAKVINARMAIHGMRPPSPYKHIDTKQLAKRSFAFTSNRLEYLSSKLCPDDAKDKHKEFPGFELWVECLAGNIKAWEEMRSYNQQDVLATRALYKRLAPWGNAPGVNLNVYHGDAVFRCECGSSDLIKRGYTYTPKGKYQRFSCNACGAWTSRTGAGNNLLSEKKKMSLKGP